MVTLAKSRGWLGAGVVLIAGLGVGCSHCCKEKSCSPCAAATPAKTAQTIVVPDVVVAKPQPGITSNSVPPVNDELSIPLDKQRPAEVVVARKPKMNEPAIVVKDKPEAGGKADVVARRSFADITARPEFAHASDHSWLVGQLHFIPQKQQWRLRYAPIDEEDRFGGGVTLDCGPQMIKPFSDGQIVRVEGSIVNVDSREPSPLYRLQTISAVSK